MRTFTRAIASTLAIIVVLLGIASFVWSNVLGNVGGLGTSLQTGAANAILDATGIKGQADSALHQNASTIAAATGLSESQVNAAIDQLDISSWSVTTLPANAQATGSFTTSYQGTQTTVTTYSDPSYVSVNAAGQTVALSVPASAQAYVPYLRYL